MTSSFQRCLIFDFAGSDSVIQHYFCLAVATISAMTVWIPMATTSTMIVTVVVTRTPNKNDDLETEKQQPVADRSGF